MGAKDSGASVKKVAAGSSYDRYQARRKASNIEAINKKKRMDRHARRVAKDKAKVQARKLRAVGRKARELSDTIVVVPQE